MRGQTENLIGILAGVIIAGVFLTVAYQLIASFGIEQQKKQAMTSLSELVNGVDYACGAGEGSTFTTPLKFPLLVKQVAVSGQKVCIELDNLHCIPVRCPVNMTPIFLNSTFWQTKARVSGKGVITVEFDLNRIADHIEITSRTTG